MAKFLFLIYLIVLESPPAFAQTMVCKKVPVSAPASCSIKSVKPMTVINDLAKACKSLIEEGYTDQFIREYRSFSAGSSMTPDDYKKSIAYKEKTIAVMKEEIHAAEKKLKTFDSKDSLKRQEAIKKIKDKLKKLAENHQSKLSAASSIAAEEKLFDKYFTEKSKLHNELQALGPGQDMSDYEETIKENQYHISIYEKDIQKSKDALATLLSSSNKGLTISDKDREEVKKAVSDSLQGMKQRPEFKDCGLSDTELYAIKMYTGQHYRAINASLRSDDVNEQKKYAAFTQAISAGLSKFQGFNELVRRGATLSDEAIKAYCNGCVDEMKAFTSTSVGDGFSGKQRFVIKGKSGAYIAPLSGSPGEREVLFPPRVKFKVLKVEMNEYTLQEVD